MTYFLIIAFNLAAVVFAPTPIAPLNLICAIVVACLWIVDFAKRM